MTETDRFNQLLEGTYSEYTLFRPILMHFAARFNHTTYGNFASDYRVLVESNLKALEYFDMDMVGLISDPYRETSAFGAKVIFMDEEVPRCTEILVGSEEDIDRLPDPDVYKCERTLDRIKGAELFRKKLKGSVPVIGWIEGPLAEACDLAGMSEIMMQVMLNPGYVERLMDKCLITAKAFAKAQIEAGCDIIGIGDAVCSQISKETYDAYVKDRHTELIAYIHEHGGKVKLHICGDITHHLPSIRETAPDILDLDWQVDLDKAYDILGPGIIRCGNINPVDIQNLSTEELGIRVRKIVKQEKGRRFILSGGCEITVNTPPENLLAMRTNSK